MVGEDDLPGQWDDELSQWPDERRHLAAKRVAFVTVCGVLITLIILTIVFVGKDKTSSAQVTTSGSSTSTLGTIGFATSLPVAATATSFATTTSGSSTTTATTSTTNPRQNTTTTTAPTTTTTAPPPPFQFSSPTPKQHNPPPPATVTFVSGNQAACPAPPNDVPASFTTNPPGTIQITSGFSPPVSGKVNSNGTFNFTAGSNNDHWTGTATQVDVKANYTNGTCVKPATYAITWTFN